MWTLPAPVPAFVGVFWPGDERGVVAGLLLTAAVSVPLALLAVRRGGLRPSRREIALTGLGQAGTVGAVLLELAVGPDIGLVLVPVTAFTLPHTALAGLAWPGARGLGRRVLHATSATFAASAVVGVLLRLVLALPDRLAVAAVMVLLATGHVAIVRVGTAAAEPLGVRGHHA